ncbi:MAG: DUF4214 domain-containing protein [Lachnospiraceae bacterium]|nr:DUF4214 domain-containing protein [Lachnospiraceae bacterium]
MKNASKKNLLVSMLAIMVIVLITVISIPMKAAAAPSAHTAHSKNANHEGWTPVMNEDQLLLMGYFGGTGYLTKDIELSGNTLIIYSGKEVNLCLNGHSITLDYNDGEKSVIRINEGATLNLYDEKGNTGKITHKSGCKGRGVYVNGGKFVLNGGNIADNTTTKSGAGIYFTENSEFIMTDGVISNNFSSKDGGAVYISNDTINSMSGGSIERNVAKGHGGAIAFVGEKIYFTMDEGSIVGNSADKDGGALYFDNPNTIYEEKSTFTMNGGSIIGNVSKSSGGGIYGYRVHTTINDGIISENVAEDGSGGGLLLWVNGFIMTGGSITGNYAGNDGGGLYLEELQDTAEISGGTISENEARYDGGGIFSWETTVLFNDGMISGNTAGRNGGGVCQEDSHFIMTGGEISENTADLAAALYLSNYEEHYLYCSFDIKGGVIRQNEAKTGCDGIGFDVRGTLTDGICEDEISYDKTLYKTLKYLPNQGSGKSFTQYCISGNWDDMEENRFTRKGFKFYNWNTKPDGSGTSFEVEDKVPEKSKKLFAQWKPNAYTVSFNANGGSGTMSSQIIKFDKSTALNKNTFKKSGYKFTGWNTKADGSGISYKDGAKVRLKFLNVNKVTLFAQWSPITASYKVEHYRQKLDGSYPSTANETEVFEGKVNASVTPSVKTYKGFTAPETKTVKIKADGSVVVTYKYTRNSYKLTWDFAGGKASGNYTKGTVKYGAKITAPVPTRDGYEFTGWDKTVPAKMPANDVTFKAKWKKLSQEEQVRKFVERFYTIILERPADEAGLNDWTNRLISKQATGADVAAGFINSDEFQKKKMTDEEYVTKLYRAFFDREPDKEGYNNWLRELKNGKTRDDVLRGFINSPEFNNLCKKYGINTGSY